MLIARDQREQSTPTQDEYSYQWESWGKIIDEALPLLRIYWNSGGVLYPDELPLDPDIPLSYALEASGRLRIFTVRRGKRLIGLNSFNVGTVLFRRRAIVAVGIILYLLPSERIKSTGVRLIRGAEDGLRDLGSHLISYMPSSSVDISRLLRICGYKQQGSEFLKLLKPQVASESNKHTEDSREHRRVG